MRIAMVLVALSIAVTGGCSSPPKPSPKEKPVVKKPPPEPPKAARGDACEPGEDDMTGNCAAGLLCAPTPGGYCMSFCGAAGTACPDDGVCLESPRGGELCAKACSSDDECRVDEGYVCDPVWNACSIPGVAAPHPPACTEPALAKKAFGAAQQISTADGPGLYHFEPAAALTADGGVAAMFIAGTAMGQPNGLLVSRVAADGTLASDESITTGRENHFDPWVAADKAGNLHAVWLGFDGGRAPEKNMVIGHATSTDGGATWSEPAPAHDVASDCPEGTAGCMDKPMIAIGPAPKAPKEERMYVFYASTFSDGMRMVTSKDGGKTFGASVAVMPGTYGDVEVGPDGAIHVVSVMGSPRSGALGSVEQWIEYTVSTDGETFAAPIRVSAAEESVPFFFVNPNVVVDAKKKLIYVLYAAGTPDGAWDIMLATTKDKGKTWTYARVNDDGDCANQMIPNAVLDPKTGKVHVIWKENRTGTGGVAYAVCDSGGKKCSANEAVSDAPFAAYSFVRHSTKWLGEYDSLLFDAKRRMLHAVWTATVDEDGKAIARIFHATAKIK